MKRALIAVLIGAILVCGPRAACAEDSEEGYIKELTQEKYKGRAVSLQLHETEVRTVLELLGRLMETNVAIHRGATGRVPDLTRVDVPVDQAFEAVLRMYNLYAVSEGKVTAVYPMDTYLNDIRERLKLKQVLEWRGGFRAAPAVWVAAQVYGLLLRIYANECDLTGARYAGYVQGLLHVQN